MRLAFDTLGPPIAIERRSPTPLHRQIYERMREAITQGRLPPGQRLPSSRVLARQLRVSRIPVVTAFEQLATEGFIEGRVGAGSFVSSALPQARPIAKPAKPKSVEPARPPWNEHQGPFRLSQPGVEGFPVSTFARLLGRRARTLTRKQMLYGSSMGFEPLREALAGHLRTVRSANCDASQLMVVSGSQLALALTGHALLKPGDQVWVEEPGYRGARDALSLSGATMVPVPVDEHGLDVDAGLAAAPKAKAVYVTPAHQYPLGTVMSAARRLRLLEWARRTGAWVIEDDYDSEYRYDGQPITSLQGLDRGGRVIYVGTFSKVLFPALRAGYLVLPHELVPRFVQVRHALDIFPPVLEQAALNDFIRGGWFSRHVRKMSEIYARRRAVLQRAIEQELFGVAKLSGASAGMHLCVLLPRGTDDRAIALAAAARGLAVMPLSSCYAGRRRPGLVLGYGTSREREIPDAVHLLSAIIRSHLPVTPGKQVVSGVSTGAPMSYFQRQRPRPKP